jgi:two-component system KDP operon response regulator KdpE
LTRVLVVDDDDALLRALRISLSARGYRVETARSGAEGLQRAAAAPPEVVVLDLGLPDLDGLEVCRRIRAWSDVPIIVLSAAGAEARKVAALDGGADDYVTKPFGLAELDARLRVAIRHRPRGAEGVETVVRSGTLEVDLPGRVARIQGRPVDLTAREFDLLAYLARHAGKVCTHRMILTEVWGPAYGTEVHYLRVYANRLRKKLGGDPSFSLRTNPGVGYQLVAESDPEALEPPETAEPAGAPEPAETPEPAERPEVSPRPGVSTVAGVSPAVELLPSPPPPQAVAQPPGSGPGSRTTR